MLHRSTLQLLRLPFSLFLLPVFLFALGNARTLDDGKVALAFFLLHFLVYPASNGYNSYMDRDEGPVGGLERPMQPTRQLYYLTIALDAAAIAAGFLVSAPFAAGLLLYIAASRAYSYRGIRLKQYPVGGFLTVFLFQGALTYFLGLHAAEGGATLRFPLMEGAAASGLIGALYPLTQVYQHEADRRDGVTTLSMVLGKRGSFLFSGALFSAATVLIYLILKESGRANLFPFYVLTTAPVVLFFLYWMRRVWQSEAAADFRHSLWMNITATAGTTIFFTLTILMRP